MQYSSFIGDHVPCRYKSLIEDSSLKQLLFASDDRPKVRPEFIAELRNRVSPKGKSKTCVEGDMKGSSTKKRQAQGEDDGPCRRLSFKEIFCLITQGGKSTRAFRGWKTCSLIHNKPILYGLPDDPRAHLHRSNSLYLSSYDCPELIRKSAKVTNFHSPSRAIPLKLSASSLHSFGQRSAMKARSCHVTGVENLTSSQTPFLMGRSVRPASSGTVPDQQDDIRSAPSSEHEVTPEEVIDVKFNHAEDVESYAANYREGYTYRKLHAQRPLSSSAPVANAMPPATTTVTKAPRGPSPPRLCPIATASVGRIETFRPSSTCRSAGAPSKVKSTPSTTRSTPTTTRSTPTTTRLTPTTTRSTPSATKWITTAVRLPATNNNMSKPKEKENQGSELDNIMMKDQENDQNLIIHPTRWPTNQRFHDLCHPQVTVKPSTEGAVLCRVSPGLQTSSPSIPSNTNGKFGGKSKDRPYPFQLHISAASCLVQSTAKEAAKFNI